MRTCLLFALLVVSALGKPAHVDDQDSFEALVERMIDDSVDGRTDDDAKLNNLSKRMNTGEADVIGKVIGMLQGLLGGNEPEPVTTPAPTAPSTTPAPTPSTTPVLPIGVKTVPFTCSFESASLCGFSSVKDTSQNVTMTWRRHEGWTSTWDTGPMVAAAGRYYMYVEVSNLNFRTYKENDTARLVSPPLVATAGSLCLKFSYHMFGKHIGSLKAYLGNNVGSPFFHQAGQMGRNEWYTSETPITATPSTPFTITWETKRGSGMLGDIAVDNVQLTSGECP